MRDWLIALRNEKGMTTQEVAKSLGISESYYCEIESGDRQKKMDMVLIASLAALFEKPIYEIAADCASN